MNYLLRVIKNLAFQIFLNNGAQCTVRSPLNCPYPRAVPTRHCSKNYGLLYDFYVLKNFKLSTIQT